MYLGHSSIKTAEKHYAPFVKARQEQMVQTMKQAWKTMANARNLRKGKRSRQVQLELRDDEFGG